MRYFVKQWLIISELGSLSNMRFPLSLL